MRKTIRIQTVRECERQSAGCRYCFLQRTAKRTSGSFYRILNGLAPTFYCLFRQHSMGCTPSKMRNPAGKYVVCISGRKLRIRSARIARAQYGSRITDAGDPCGSAAAALSPHVPGPAHNSLQGKPLHTGVLRESPRILYIYPAQYSNNRH